MTYTDEGLGPAVLCVHGLPGSVRDFRWLAAAIRQEGDARIVRVDMPGFGGTDPALVSDWSVASRGGFVARFLEALEIERCVLVGHSNGGALVMAAASMLPERVAGLGLLASIGLRPHHGYRSMPSPRGAAAALRAPLLGRALRPALRWLFVRSGFPRSTTTEEMFVTMQCVGALRFEEIRAFADLDALAGRIVVASADDDRLVEPEISLELASHFAAKHLRFDTGGHNIQKTRAVELAKGLLELAGRSG